MYRAVLFAVLLALAVGQFGSLTLVVIRHQRGLQRTEEMRSPASGEERDGTLIHLSFRPFERSASQPSFVRIGHHEVLFDGRLYDVVFEEMRGDALHIWGTWDRDEEAAMAHLRRSLDADSGDSAIMAASPSLRNVSLLYVSLVSPASEPSPRGSIRFSLQRTLVVSPPFREVPQPPPRA